MIALHKEATEGLAAISDQETRSPENDWPIKDSLQKIQEEAAEQ